MIIFIVNELTPEQKEAMDILFRTQNLLYYNIANQRLHSAEQAEEVVAEAYIKMLGKIDTLMRLTPSEREAYGVMVVKREVLQYVRRREHRIPNLSYEEYTPLAIGQPGYEYTEDDVIDLLDKERLNSMLKDLEPGERDILLLHYGHNMAYAEIAKLLNISADAAQKRGNRAVKRLKRRMLEEDEGFGVTVK